MSFVGIIVDLDVLFASVVEAACANAQVTKLGRVRIWAENGGETGLGRCQSVALLRRK